MQLDHPDSRSGPHTLKNGQSLPMDAGLQGGILQRASQVKSCQSLISMAKGASVKSQFSQ